MYVLLLKSINFLEFAIRNKLFLECIIIKKNCLEGTLIKKRVKSLISLRNTEIRFRVDYHVETVLCLECIVINNKV